MSEDTFSFTDANFAESTASGVALVDLYADWCGPCKMMAPLIDKVAAQYAGRATVGKLNVDDSPEAAGQLGVTSIPTVVVYKDGEEVERLVGAQSEANLQKVLDNHL
ncbi:MAG: thioredoxin [Planctomycetes bacterium]|nr:thioredoxin [Planctomycetota bacterium]